MRRFAFLCLALCAAVAGCEGARNNSSWSHRDKGQEIVPSLHKDVPHDVAKADSAATDSTDTGSKAHN